MAGAPHKQELDYFAFPVNTFQDPLIQELIETYKAAGFMFWMQLKAAIFSKSHYLKWDKIQRRVFRQTNEYRDEEIDIYLPYLINIGLLNKKMFDQFGILTSEQIQETYLMSTKGRTKVIFIDEYTLLDFNSFRFFDQIIYIQTIGGELLERFYKKSGLKMDPETKTPLKSPKNKATATQKPPKHSHQEVKSNVPAYKEYTYKNINQDIKVPYDEHDDIFKETYSKEEYNNFVTLNQKINNQFENVRWSNRQLSFPEYIEFMEESDPKPDIKELEAAFNRMSHMRVTKDTDIYRSLEECLQYIRKEKKPPDLPEDNTAYPYIDDPVLEEALLGFWKMTKTTHHKNYLIIKSFLTTMSNNGQLDWFKTQFEFYTKYKVIKGLNFKHSFKNFFGSQDKKFDDGEWNGENWEQKLIEENTKIKDNGTKVRRGDTEKAGYGKF